MTPPRNAGLHNWWRTCKRARSPIPGVSPCPLSDPPLSPSTAPTSWGREGEPSRKTAQVLSPTGNRQPQCWTALEKRGTVPCRGVRAALSGCLKDLGSLCYSQEMGSWHSSLPPQPQEGANTSKCCICSMPKTTLLPHLYLALGRERRPWR